MGIQKKREKNIFFSFQDKMLFEFCLIALASGQMFKKVKLKDVDVLTLYQGKMTNGRRSSPVPQLSCRGGTAGCGAFVPEVVQCYVQSRKFMIYNLDCLELYIYIYVCIYKKFLWQ